MNARAITLTVVAAALVLAAIGCILLATNVTVLANGDTVVCEARASFNTEACKAALATRDTWAWTLIVLGLLSCVVATIVDSNRNPAPKPKPTSA